MEPTAVDGIPEWLPDHLASAGVEALYPPQAAAVEAGITRGESVVASVPTASGKTLVAELAMLASVDTGGKALYIVPLRALASEKKAEFEQFDEYGVSVGVSTGNYESNERWLGQKDIVVATSEKVDSLVRNGADWLSRLDCVVSDEVHLVDDANRGPTLEVTLAKLRRINPNLQVVALSATIGNASELAGWLDAELVDSEWRPIELRKGVHYGQALHLDDGDQRELRVNSNERSTEAIVRHTLSEEVDDQGGSALVFVNSRRNAESAASRLAETTESMLEPAELDRLAAVAERIRGVSDTDTSDDLADCVAKGAAFHHAGLRNEQRSLVEDAFRDRLIRCVSATPTLAAGVNTPSRRVIVRDWRRYSGDAGGMTPLSVLEVHQMMGRAGRPGMDPYGEAVLLAKSHDELEELFERYVWAEPEPVRSKLAAEPAMRTHILATVASGFASSRETLLEFLEETLYATQTDEQGRLERVTDRMVGYLEANGFVETAADGRITATEMGHEVSRLYIDPMSAAEIVDGLAGARSQEPDALGLYHLISRTPDMYELYLRSGDREQLTMEAYKREESFLGAMPSEFDDEAFEDWLSALKTALLLRDWAEETDEDRITEEYNVGPGDIRGKVDVAQWLLGAAESLAATLNRTDEAGEQAPDIDVAAIRRARKRVEDGVKEELLDLTGVRAVGRKRARRLYDAGIEVRADLREAEKSVVLGALRGRRKTAETVLENAGHQSPSMEGVEPDSTAAPAIEADGQRSGGTETSAEEGNHTFGDFEDG